MLIQNQAIKKVLGWLIIGTRGGKNRAKILRTVKNTPQNANQIATRLNVDYKTIRHHLNILEKNRLIIPVGDTYSTAYALSEHMEENYQLFEEITNKQR